jgi:hypothetical protein
VISEIVLDTNVLAHCYNPIEERSSDALALVELVRNSTAALCVDDGFHPDEARNRSVIGAEYRTHLAFGTPGFYLIQHLAASGRIHIYPKRGDRETSRQINRVVRDRGDRVFLGVAWNSSDKVLVSHDYTDFSADKRDHLKREIGVCIVDSRECLDSYCEA